MSFRHIVAACAIACFVTGCSSGPVRRITPSQVSVQELVANPDGQWRVTLRIQNFSTISMQYAALHATLSVAGLEFGAIDLTPDLDIPQNSAEVIDVKLRAAGKLPAGDIEYKISGTIDTSEPKENFKFERSSRLSPAPGLANTWR